MNRKELKDRYNLLSEYLNAGKLKFGIDLVSELIRQSGKSDYFYQIDTITDNYKSLLKYSVGGYKDPQQQSILNNLAVSIHALADEIFEQLEEPFYPQREMEKLVMRRIFGDDPSAIVARVDEFLFTGEIKKMVEDTGASLPGTRSLEHIFKLIWLTGRMSDPLASLISRICKTETLEWYEKCLIVSSLTLSALTSFDPRKIILLCEFVATREKQVYHRALTGLILLMIRYDQRIIFYPEIKGPLFELSNDEGIRNDVETILLQLLMAMETEKITKEFEEELLPEMKKMLPKIEDKLQLGNLFEEEDMEGKNPVWQEMMEEVPGLFERIEKFSKMQLEGGDVFMSTFSMLKRFDFFDQMSNWFIPFYAANPDLQAATSEEEQMIGRLIEGLEKAYYICNSDKYSFALNFNAVPAQQRSMIITHFEAELEQMKEMISEEEILGQSVSSNAIFTQYIQDVYRFFKLYPNKNEFDDIFLGRIHFNRLYFFKTYFERENFTGKLADFYFNNDHYPEAIELYLYLSEKETPSGALFEKLAYSCQKLGKFREAIEYYRKADLFGSNRLWILKKLGWCHMKIGDHKNAIQYFEEASRLQPDDLTLQARIGQCHLVLKQYEEALQYYLKVQYFQPDNMKTLRPVAWCNFVLGKLGEAKGFYESIQSSGFSVPFDAVNYGHVLLCLGKRKEALDQYKNAFNAKLFTQEMFLAAFEEDIPFLLSNGVGEEDIRLILDWLLFRF